MITPNFDDFANNKSLISAIEGNLPELKKNFEILKGLTTQAGSQENFDTAINAFYWIFDCVPLAGPFLDSFDMPIFRARPNEKKNMLFSKVTDISYNSTRPEVICEGRFNQRQEAVFYAALPVSNDFGNASMFAILETCKGLTDQDHPVSLKDFTIGRWKIVKPFYVVNFCFDEAHLQGNPPLKDQTEKYLNFIRTCLNAESSEFILQFLTYFSMLSGNRSELKHDYYLLTAMFYAIQIYYKEHGTIINGLIYPSAMTEKKGLNIVLTTTAVDEYLKIDKVGMYRFFLDGKTYHCDPCCDAVDVKDGQFQITGFRRIPEERWYTVECENLERGRLKESRD